VQPARLVDAAGGKMRRDRHPADVAPVLATAGRRAAATQGAAAGGNTGHAAAVVAGGLPPQLVADAVGRLALGVAGGDCDSFMTSAEPRVSMYCPCAPKATVRETQAIFYF